jgi:hypothetical protein
VRFTSSSFTAFATGIRSRAALQQSFSVRRGSRAVVALEDREYDFRDRIATPEADIPMSTARTGLAERLGHIGVTGLGVVLAVTPVALWIAWTATLVVCVMLVAIVSAALFAWLTERLRERTQIQSGSEGAFSGVALPDEFIEDVHRLFPLTYHHSRLETPRFRQAMKRLSQLIEQSKRGDTPV